MKSFVFQNGSMVKNSSAIAGDDGLVPGWGRFPWTRKWLTHSSILAWEVPRTEGPGRLRSMMLQKVGHDWVANQQKHFQEYHQESEQFTEWEEVFLGNLTNMSILFRTYKELLNSILKRWAIELFKNRHRIWIGDFVGGLIDWTLPSSAAGAGLIPGRRAKITHVSKGQKKKKKKKNRDNIVTNSINTLKTVHLKKIWIDATSKKMHKQSESTWKDACWSLGKWNSKPQRVSTSYPPTKVE